MTFTLYSPISIKLGLYHSLLSIISISVPILLCLYISLKFQRKYILRSYLAVALGQTLFSLFIYYGPYELTSLWCSISPILALLGVSLTYLFIYYLFINRSSKNYPWFFYLYFFGIMFLNPLRFGALTPFFLSIDLLPSLTVFYFLVSFCTFFVINTGIGLVVNHYSQQYLEYYRDESKFQTRILLALLTTSVLFWMRLTISLIYWYPLRLVNVPENLPESFLTQLSEKFPVKKTVIAEFYNNTMTLFKKADYYNVRTRWKVPSAYKYEKLDAFLELREYQLQEDELKIRFISKDVISSSYLAKRGRHLGFEKLGTSLRIFLRTPQNINIPFQPIPRRSGIPIGECEVFKSHSIEQNKIRFARKNDNKTFLREISWVRTLAKRTLFPLNRFENSQSSFLPNSGAIENLLEQKMISDIEPNIDSIYSTNTIELFKFLTQEKILTNKKLNRKDLNEKELLALDILSEKIVKKEILAFVSKISQKQEDLDSMKECFNQPLSNRLRYYSDAITFREELAIKKVVSHELFLQNKYKDLKNTLVKSPFLSILKKQFNTLLLANLQKSTLIEDSQFISSLVQNEYNLAKYKETNTVRLNDLVFIQTGFSPLNIKYISKGNFEKLFYPFFKSLKEKRDLISKDFSPNLFDEKILHPISSFSKDKKIHQLSILIPTGSNNFKLNETQMMKGCTNNIQLILTGRGKDRPNHELKKLQEKTLYRFLKDGEKDLYKLIKFSVKITDFKKEIKTTQTRVLGVVGQVTRPIQYALLKNDRSRRMVIQRLKLDVLPLRKKHLYSEQKQIEKEYKSYCLKIKKKFSNNKRIQVNKDK
jgi:hypothetical protein